MRLLVTGGRKFNDTCMVNSALRRLHDLHTIEHVIHGAATGADTIAKTWAQFEPHVTETGYPAEWDNIDHPVCRIKFNKYDKPYNVLAGFNRNQQMIVEGCPSHCLAFPGGNGTADMVAKARKHDIEVLFALEILQSNSLKTEGIT